MNAPYVPPVPPAPPVPKKPRILGISKTSLQGWLTVLMVVLLQLSVLQLPSTLATPYTSHILTWVTFISTTVVGIVKAILSLTQGDATSS